MTHALFNKNELGWQNRWGALEKMSIEEMQNGGESAGCYPHPLPLPGFWQKETVELALTPCRTLSLRGDFILSPLDMRLRQKWHVGKFNVTAAAAASLGGGRARNGDAGMYGDGGVCITEIWGLCLEEEEEGAHRLSCVLDWMMQKCEKCVNVDVRYIAFEFALYTLLIPKV